MRTFVIAEAGVNHNGSPEIARKMITEAKRAGADAIKFQTFRAADLVTAGAPKAEYQNSGDDSADQLQMLRRLELGDTDFALLADECRQAGIEFMSTPFSLPAARFLHGLGMKKWKIASGEITNLPLLEYIAGVAETVILSTGMSTLDEVAEALDVLYANGARPDNTYLLHCTTAYPTPPADVNLRVMDTLRRFGTAGVGYSDHTRGTLVAAAAVAMGACMVEKHFTLDRDMAGPDHKASLLPDELERMINDIRTVELALGNGSKQPVASETGNVSVARKSITASRPIRRGEVFGPDNLTTKRPGTGISPMKWHSLTGRKAGRDYLPDQLISENELL